MTPYERELLDDLTEALEQSNQVMTQAYIHGCKAGAMPAMPGIKGNPLWTRKKANEELLARVMEATRTGAVVAS